MRRRDPIPLAGRVVAVTGAAHGIGRATAEALAARGARVGIGDLDAPAARATAAGIGRGAVGAALDVTDRASFAAFLAGIEAAHGPLDVLVNNAGVMHVGAFLDESDAWSRRQVDVNLHGVICGMRLALGPMVARGSGHVVNVASMAARIGVRHEAVYAATKWAVAGLSESVRQELRGTGVELSVVHPGIVRTALASGTTETRGVTVLEPADVAAAIVAVLERPRFDVFVPSAYGPLAKVAAVLPRRGREAFLRALGAERHTAAVTVADRAAYERRIEALAEPEPGGGH